MKYFITLVVLLFGQWINAQLPNDCVNAIVVCGNGSFTSNATGRGNIQEVTGCSGAEHNSLWLKVNVVQSGTLGFHIRPLDQDLAVDYDFWVYAANRNCSNLGTPIRCATTNPLAAGLSTNFTGMIGSSTLTQTGPGAVGNGYVRWLNVAAGESYYIAIDRPEGDGGFELEWIGSATEGNGAFSSAPIANFIPDQSTCTVNPDVGIFDLNSYRSQINNDLELHQIDFFETLENALDNFQPLPNIIVNRTNPQRIYAKVSNKQTGCFTVVDFQLIANPLPTATISISETTLCPGNELTLIIEGTPDAVVEYQIGTHEVRQAILDNTGYYEMSDFPMTATTYRLRSVSNLAADGSIVCRQPISQSRTVAVPELEIPDIQYESEICQGSATQILFSGNPNARVVFSVNGVEDHVVLDENGIGFYDFANVTINQTVQFTKVERLEAPFCVLDFDHQISILVSNMPSVESDQSYRSCGDTDDGRATFDLDEISSIIQEDLGVGFEIGLYASLELALQSSEETLPNMYVTSSSTVFVRVSNSIGCWDVFPINLEVSLKPNLVNNLRKEICSGGESSTGFFDLNDIIYDLSSQSDESFYFSIFHTMSDALLDVNRIGNWEVFESTSTSLFVRVSNEFCYQIVEVNLIVLSPPIIIGVEPILICDLDGDGVEHIDLFSILDNITYLNPNDQYDFEFYTTGENALTKSFPIPNPNSYDVSISSAAQIWIRVEYPTTGCYAIVDNSIVVHPGVVELPSKLYSRCDDDLDPDGFTNFDLTFFSNEWLQELGSEAFSFSYHLTQVDAVEGSNAILNPENFTNTRPFRQLIYVRVSPIIGGACYSLTTLDLRVEVNPSVSILSDHNFDTICVDYTTGEVLSEVVLRSSITSSTYDFLWYYNGSPIVGATNSSYVVDTNNPGVYMLELSKGDALTNCGSIFSRPFEVRISGPANIIGFETSQVFEYPAAIEVEVEGYGEYWFQLNDGPILDNRGVFQSVTSGVHTVTVYDKGTGTHQCDEVTIYGIQILSYPKFFTPNGDGFNDYWNISALNNDQNAMIIIFDRYGKLITKFKPSQQGWDGSLNGEPLPSNDYWFVVYYSSEQGIKEFKSHFTLKR